VGRLNLHITVCLQNKECPPTLFIDIPQGGVLIKSIYIYYFNISDLIFPQINNLVRFGRKKNLTKENHTV
jgi:hypothetical protein